MAAKQPPVRIVVDVHEDKSGIATVLADELGADVEAASLPAGDYAVGADTLVERKRVLDLHAAVTKGRLWPQLAKLRAAAAFPYLLVEGTDIDRGPARRRASSDAAAGVLAAVPGISTTSARALLARFGSVAGVVAAGREAWLEVPGIGPDRARRWKRRLPSSSAASRARSIRGMAAASDDEARRAFAVPPASGSLGEIDLALLDPADPDERRFLIEAEQPELAEVLEDGDDVVVVDGEEMNPRLHLTIHEVVATQLWENDPPEAWQTARRLLEQGYERHEILHMLGSALVPRLWRVITDQQPADHEAYLRALAALPGSWEREGGARRHGGSAKRKLATRAEEGEATGTETHTPQALSPRCTC